MGLLVSRIFNLLSEFGNRQVRIVMLGLDAAGKTTILYKLKLKETVSTIPTIGFNVETLQPTKNVTFTIWDVGGQDKIRPLWRHYFQGTEGLLYVVDSSDILRLQEAKEELYAVLESDEFRGVPVVVIANKQDLPNAIKAGEMARELGLLKHKGNPWHIQEACAVNGDGLYEAMDRMVQMVKEFHKTKG